jgi:rhodanese-related sulfurtransferase
MFGFGVMTITIQQLAEKIASGDATIVDVREPDEFAAGHVPGAVNVPLGTLPGGVDGYDRHAEVLLICQSGHRSATGARRLKKAGFTEAASVKGGTAQWTARLER